MHLKTENILTVNLVVDEGNSNIKIALFDQDGGKMINVFRFEKDSVSFSNLKSIIEGYGVNRAIFSTVAKENNPLENSLRKLLPSTISLTHQTPIPITIDYKSPLTLGVDRIATAVEAWHINRGATSLVVDAGTAITFDIVDSSGSFVGGNISLGIDMRFKSLNSYTSRLPLLEKSLNYPTIGYDTQSAIISGIMHGVVSEIKSYISLMYDKYADLSVIITGGDNKILYDKLKNSTFASIKKEEHLLINGLNRILTYNANK